MQSDLVAAIVERIRAEMKQADHYVRPDSGVVRFCIRLVDLNALLQAVKPGASDPEGTRG